MATRMKVIYLDGRTEEVVVSPRVQVMTEQHVGGISEKTALRSDYYMAWLALSRAGKESAAYDTWLDQIDDVEKVDNERVDPTVPAQQSDTSSS